MRIQTDKLKQAVTLLHTVAGRYNALVMTCLLTLRVRDNTLYLYSTDRANTLVASIEFEGECENLDTSIGIEQAFKLIKTLDSEFVDLTIKDNSVIIKSGKSKYTLKVVLDSQGNPALIAEPTSFCNGEFKELNIDDKVYSQLSMSLPAEDFVIEIYRNVYFGDCVIVTNSICASKANTQVFEDEVLLKSKIFSILHNFDSISMSNSQAILKSDMYELYTIHDSSAIDSFHATELKEMFNASEYEAEYDINEMKNALKRLTAFNPDNITIEFKENSIVLEIQDTATEVLDVISNSFTDFKYTIDFKIFKKYISKTVDNRIYFGCDNCIQLGKDDVSHIICATLTLEV